MKDLIDKATRTAQAGIDSASGIWADLPLIGDYQDKDRRREADRRLRESIAVSLEASRKRVVALERNLLNKGKLTSLPYVDIAANQMQTIIDRIRTAPSGYAGFFDLETIRESELEKLHQFDKRIAASLPEIRKYLDEMAHDIDVGEDFSSALSRLIKGLEALSERLDHRKEAIRAVGDETGKLPEASAAADEEQ